MINGLKKVSFLGRITVNGSSKIIRISKPYTVFGLEMGKTYKITIEEYKPKNDLKEGD